MKDKKLEILENKLRKGLGKISWAEWQELWFEYIREALRILRAAD